MSIINNIIPQKWEAWFAPMGEDSDITINDIFKTYFGTYRYAEKRANKDRPNGYELIELVKPFRPKKKHRKIYALIQCLYKPCIWNIYSKNKTINRFMTGSLLQVIIYLLKNKIMFAKISIWADPVEMADPNWLPF